MIFSYIKYHEAVRIEEDEMGGSYGFYGGQDKWIQGFVWKSLRKGRTW